MNTPDQNEINIGIDTSQSMLDIYVRPQGIFQPLENNPEGIQSAIRFIKQFKPTPVLIEATGRLEMAFFCAAHKAGLPVCVCNPIQVRKFAQATPDTRLNALQQAASDWYPNRSARTVPSEGSRHTDSSRYRFLINVVRGRQILND